MTSANIAATAAQCADVLLEIAQKRDIVDLTPMKLQKLLYFGQGLSLASTDMPLFAEEFQAWRYGPVLPSIYRRFKSFGSDAVPVEHPYRTDISCFPANSRKSLEEVMITFGALTPARLSALSHAAGGPWAKVFLPASVDTVIPQQEMRTYFSKLIEPAPSKRS
jgi:uncharacterized phage-associated protein